MNGLELVYVRFANQLIMPKICNVFVLHMSVKVDAGNIKK